MYKKDLALNNLQWLICHKTEAKRAKYNWFLCHCFVQQSKEIQVKPPNVPHTDLSLHDPHVILSFVNVPAVNKGNFVFSLI